MDLMAAVPIRATGLLRWTARVLGLLVVLFVLAWDIGGLVAIAIERSVEPLQVVEALVLTAAAATLALAWRLEKLGGSLAVLTGLVIGIVVLFTVEPDRRLYLFLVTCLPLIVIGGAFLAADRVPFIHRAKRDGVDRT